MSIMVSDGTCPFCKSSARHWNTNQPIPLYGFDCEVCKQYFMSEGLLMRVKDLPINAATLNCISENIASNSKEGEIFTSWHLNNEIQLPSLASNITVKRYEVFASTPIVHADKAKNLLNILATKLEQKPPFSEGTLSVKDFYTIKIKGFEEGYIWLHELWRAQLIDSIHFKKMENASQYIPSDRELSDFYFQITPKGWEQVYSNQRSVNSRKVFIAMQFNWEASLDATKTAFIEAIKQGCGDCGYEAELVSDQHHIDQITDRIIAKIKSARFVVTDFTFNNRGAYYEAGLARGLGIPVIHTVMRGHTADPSDKEKQLHFDIKQINYLEWSDPSEIRERLRDRIKAVIER